MRVIGQYNGFAVKVAQAIGVAAVVYPGVYQGGIVIGDGNESAIESPVKGGRKGNAIPDGIVVRVGKRNNTDYYLM